MVQLLPVSDNARDCLFFVVEETETAPPFVWRWQIVCISVFLTFADMAYFYALSHGDVLISVVSMIRRGSVLVSFAFGCFLFKEKNVKSKLFDLLLVLLSMVCLCIGGE